MTDKQVKILKAALVLFAEQGYEATSTSKVAKEAGVSEGLIFRHFNSKEGLLNAIRALINASAIRGFDDVLTRKDPKAIIRGVLEFPFTIDDDKFLLWKLIYSIQWQKGTYENTIYAPIQEVLITAFDTLGYVDPEAEADAVLMLFDGIATAVLLKNQKNQEGVLKAILEKYQL